MGVAESLERHLNSFLVMGGVGTVATVSSTSAAGAVGDQQDANIREINNIRIDVDTLNKTVSDLVATLRSNGLIQT